MNDKKYGLATTYSDGLMSAADKSKLDNLTPGGGGDMLKSVYDTNDDGIVDASSAVQIQNTVNTIRFGIDGDGNYGYYKVGADTVTPFKSGSSETETVLWSNPNGTTIDNKTSFAAQQITLSQAASGFDKLRIYYKSVANPGSGTPVVVTCDYFLDNISRMVGANNNGAIAIGTYYGSSYSYARGMYFTNTTYLTMQVCACYRLNTQSNSYCIPLKVCGIKV